MSEDLPNNFSSGVSSLLTSAGFSKTNVEGLKKVSSHWTHII